MVVYLPKHSYRVLLVYALHRIASRREFLCQEWRGKSVLM